MAGISIDVSGLNELSLALKGAGARAGALVSKAVRKSALDIQRDAKDFCPVDTGFLQGSIGIDLLGDGRSAAMEAQIGPTANYGAYVEFGTARMAPRAYMGPAFDRHSGAFEAAMEQIAGRVLE